ncbi:CPBP family intramembrane glutamic endopeptidase [Winogradskyella sp.]|jgi:membrane protease YdiL (CAAX protease family)|uniref:CPBP family intramembrane glutamic endopeptidase n=1 Tax=Winogradskyella sp. TaxID=1883156 RepID=UPI0025D04C82|nr:CPBP family intramembrane glutamic endopeptidase [Winogradskyella sp.]MCT4629050.1 CPBP family intramembrane metalloprotease [Winogradskyella sp.]
MPKAIQTSNQKRYTLDLIIYIAIMFLIRETSIPNTHYLVTGFLYSGTTLIVASLMMKRRGVTWKSLGLRRPKSIKKTLLSALVIFITVIATFLIFNIIQDQFAVAKDSSEAAKGTITGYSLSNGDYAYVFSVIVFVWLQSALEELLERGFLITWVEGVLSNVKLRTAIAIVFQACIWGFRHSYDISERSISVALVGIVMGIAYVKLDRNLWPVIIAHSAMNTMSLI